jgi:exodeoxyribonuclease VII small subunit
MHLARKSQTELPTDFETALVELEALVERLERGDLPLEEALRSFERGVGLTRQCQGALQSAQQKVEILLKKPGGEIAGGESHSIESFDVG